MTGPLFLQEQRLSSAHGLRFISNASFSSNTDFMARTKEFNDLSLTLSVRLNFDTHSFSLRYESQRHFSGKKLPIDFSSLVLVLLATNSGT